jgi:hypothetical protein
MLTPLESHYLSLTSRKAYKAVTSFRHRAFQINKVLAPFIADWACFQQLMDKTGAVISGSQAVHFFERTQPDYGSDLDIYVEHHLVGQLAEFLLHSEGYCSAMSDHKTAEQYLYYFEQGTDPVNPSSPYTRACIARVYNFCRSDGKKIQIITAVDAVMAVILRFHSSTSYSSLCIFKQ